MIHNIDINPLLEESRAPFASPQFNEIEKRHYLSAFKEAIMSAKKEIDGITECVEVPDFENTIEALEYSGRLLSEIEKIFFNLLEADSDEQMQEIAELVSPMLTDYRMYVSLNKKLFERVKYVFLNPGQLDSVRMKLLKETYLSFKRGGAELSEDDKKQYGQWAEELALMELKFGKNVLDATNAFVLHLTEKEDLEGLPNYVVEAGAMVAKEKGESGWIFTLDYPSYSPFMKYCANRDLRRKMYMAYSSRGVGGDFDNTDIIRQIVELRMNISNLLGYDTYADYALEDRMVKRKEAVDDFISKLMAPSLQKARKELSELLSFAIENGFDGDFIMPWDFNYWAEKYQQKKFSIDEEALKPYFKLENCLEAVLGLATRLYGITFNIRKDIPVYHKDMVVYDVQDYGGEHLALFYADFFPRASKRGGAWMTEFRGQFVYDGNDYRPFVCIVTNFSKPTSKLPSLLTHNELTTLLHEFGHSLHCILSKGQYPSLSGTEVARDFVELPSQIMENWAFEPDFLNSFARHYQTGERIPSELIDRIVSSRNYMSAYQQVRQLQFAIVDMAWHTLSTLSDKSVIEFENAVLEPYRTLPKVEGTAVCPSFGHIFSGGYAAGYYSYKWAEVLEADAFSLFKEKGIFDKEVAGSFRKNILERGSSEDEDVLYRNFRGHSPEPEALLSKLGII